MLFIRRICKAKHNRRVQLLVKAAFPFPSSSVRIYKHHCHTVHVTNDDAVTFPNLASSSPGVLVWEGSDETYRGCLCTRGEDLSLEINYQPLLTASSQLGYKWCLLLGIFESEVTLTGLVTGQKQTFKVCTSTFLFISTASQQYNPTAGETQCRAQGHFTRANTTMIL